MPHRSTADKAHRLRIVDFHFVLLCSRRQSLKLLAIQGMGETLLRGRSTGALLPTTGEEASQTKTTRATELQRLVGNGLSTEILIHRAHSGLDVQLSVDAGHVRSHGINADAHELGYLFVHSALGKMRQDVVLAGG